MKQLNLQKFYSESSEASYSQVGDSEFCSLSLLTNMSVKCWRKAGLDDSIKASVGLVALEKATMKPVCFKFNYSETEKALSFMHLGEEVSVEEFCQRLGRPMADTIIAQTFKLTESGKASNSERKEECTWCFLTCLSDSPEE